MNIVNLRLEHSEIDSESLANLKITTFGKLRLCFQLNKHNQLD